MKKKYKVIIGLSAAIVIAFLCLFIVENCNTPYEATYSGKIIYKVEYSNSLYLYIAQRERVIVLTWDSSHQDPFELNKYYSITVDHFPSGRSNLISYEEINNVTN